MKRRMRSALNRTHSLLKVLVLACLVLTFLCRLVLSRTREASAAASRPSLLLGGGGSRPAPPLAVVPVPAELRPSDAGSSDRSAWRGGQGSTQASIDPAYGFNVEVCRQIAVDRPIPDARPAACKSERFDDAALEPAAIIIVEFNEARCTLHRTLHSVIARSPAALLREIVLVDDYSDWPIDPDICALPKVSAHRNTRREGLIRSRMLGVGYSSAPVLVFLDSHVEVNVGWLQPLLAQIAADRTRVVAPIIDDIDYKTFMYKMVVLEQLGHFDWHLTFEWKPLSAANRARQGGEHKPFDTPIHAGGLYAIARSWFDELGAYDRGMDIWGFENAELSFRSWQCGGTLQMLPCSRVGHVFRRHNPYLSASASPLSRNRYRAAVVWMDEYAQLVSGVSAFRPGPEDERWLDERRAIRSRCRPFEWYLREVVPERDVPRNTTALVAGTGRGGRGGDSERCLRPGEGRGGVRLLELGPCSVARPGFELHDDQTLRVDGSCIAPLPESACAAALPSSADEGLRVGRGAPPASGGGACVGLRPCTSSVDSQAHWGWHALGDDGDAAAPVALSSLATGRCLQLEEEETSAAELRQRIVLGECSGLGALSWTTDCGEEGTSVWDRELAGGGVRSLLSEQCLDSLGRGPGGRLATHACHDRGGNQAWRLTADGQLRHPSGVCAVARRTGSVEMQPCAAGHAAGAEQAWRVLPPQKLQHVSTGKCLTGPLAGAAGDLLVDRCSSGNKQQRWLQPGCRKRCGVLWCK